MVEYDFFSMNVEVENGMECDSKVSRISDRKRNVITTCSRKQVSQNVVNLLILVFGKNTITKLAIIKNPRSSIFLGINTDLLSLILKAKECIGNKWVNGSGDES